MVFIHSRDKERVRCFVNRFVYYFTKLRIIRLLLEKCLLFRSLTTPIVYHTRTMDIRNEYGNFRTLSYQRDELIRIIKLSNSKILFLIIVFVRNFFSVVNRIFDDT